MTDWLKLQFSQLADTLILCVAFVGSCGLVLHLAHHNMDQSLISWGQSLCSGFGGALLLRLNRKADDKATADTSETTKAASDK